MSRRHTTVDAGLFRRLWPLDRDKIRDHLLRLHGDDRMLRFAGHVSDARIEEYCRDLDWTRTVVLGYVVDGKVRGIGELKPTLDGQARDAEIALSVERRLQNRGVGSELLRRLIVIARNRSIGALHMVCLLENAKVRRLVGKQGATLTFDAGEVEARLPLPRSTHLTLFLELLDDAGSMLAVLRERPRSAPANRGRARRLSAG
jgi:GNAT superfamily N-acetyltransferase